jgi:hypothetical protein
MALPPKPAIDADVLNNMAAMYKDARVIFFPPGGCCGFLT